MKLVRLFALVLGCLLVLPGIGLLLGGGALGVGYAFQRDDAGYVSTTVELLESPTAAITTENLDLVTDPGSPDWLLERLDADVRIEVTSAPGVSLFVGIGRAADVDAYLAGVAHDEVVDTTDDTADYRRSDGQTFVVPPAQQTFWAESASGVGPQRLDWAAATGRWAVVLMNSDGSPGVTGNAAVRAKAGFIVPLSIILLVGGAVIFVAAVLLIVVGARGGRTVLPPAPTPAPSVRGSVSASPVSLEARLDPLLSRWLWLVKWLLVMPHLVVLALLWMAFVVLTLVAGVTILFTGNYPRGIFDINVGVLQWTWRVSYYATSGGIGTDRYPPFRLGREPDYPATLDVAYPAQLSRSLVLVKWLLGLPHYLIVTLLLGGSLSWFAADGGQGEFAPLAGGLLGLLVVIAGVVLLASGAYPRELHDLIVGLNRWVYRVVAYAALMTDQYPPFRLDQGGREPSTPPQEPFPAEPSVVDLSSLGREPAGG